VEQNNIHSTRTYLSMKMEQTECAETSAYKFQTPGNHPKESIQHNNILLFNLLATRFGLYTIIRPSLHKI